MKQRLAILAIMVLTALAYWPGLAGPLVLDDHANLEPLLRWMHGDIGWRSIVFSNLSGPLGRPISMATFLANVATTGESVYWMKVTNLALHLGCGIAIYAFLTTCMRLNAFVSGTPATVQRWIPGLATAIWLLHPMLVSTVLYVVQRMAILASLFALLAMLSYLHGRIALADGRRMRAAILLGIAVPAGTVLATLSKETGLLVPALCGLMEWLIFRPTPGKDRAFVSRAFITAMLFAPVCVVLLLVATGNSLIVGGYVNRTFTMTERILTQTRVLWDYVGAILLPYGPRLGLYHDDFPISHSVFAPASTVVAILGWVATVVVAYRLRNRVPALAFGIGVFLLGQALESTVFPLLMYFEHRVYLPAIGIIWAALGLATAAGQAINKRMHHGNTIFASAAVALVLALGLATAARSSIWRYQRTILEQALATHPDSRWLRMDLAAYAMAQHPADTAGAIGHASHLMTLSDPNERRFGALLLLSIECIKGDPIGAARMRQVFGGQPATIEPDLLVAYESLAGRITKHPCPGIDAARMASALDGMLDRTTLPIGHRSMWRLRFQTARLYWLAGDLAAALQQAQLAWAARPRDAAVPLFLAGLQLQAGQRQAAAAMLENARLRIRPGDATGLHLLEEYRAALDQAQGTE